MEQKRVIRILIVDSDVASIEKIKSVLLSHETKYDLYIESEINPDFAMEKISSLKSDVVIMEAYFPNEKDEKFYGVESILPMISGRFPDVQTIIYTSFRGNKTDVIQAAYAWSAVNFLDKQLKDSGKHLANAVIEAYQNRD